MSEQCGGTYDLPEGFEREFDDIVTGNNQVCIYNFTSDASQIEFEIYSEEDTDILLLLYTEDDELFTFPIMTNWTIKNKDDALVALVVNPTAKSASINFSV